MRSAHPLFAVVLTFIATVALANDYRVGTIEISNPWSRATPKGAKIGAGYLSIKNTGPTPDRLIGGSAEISDSFQMHEMTMEQGVAKMRELKNGIEIKPGETVEFKPGSSHVMFVNLKHQLQQGEHFKGTLVFEKAGTINIEFMVLGMGATMPGHEHGPTEHKM